MGFWVGLKARGIAPYYEDDAVCIIHADCRDVLPLLEPGSIDLVLTDPPYGEHHISHRRGKFHGLGINGDTDTTLRDWVLGWWGVQKQTAVFGKWSVPKWGQPRSVLVWSKGPASGMGDLTLPWKPSWEDIAIYGPNWQGKRTEGVLTGPPVLSWSGKSGQRLHPTEKPVWLLQELLAKAPMAKTILDPFMGSGTTLRAAKDLGRKAIGIEIEERYCEIAAKRMAQVVMPL